MKYKINTLLLINIIFFIIAALGLTSLTISSPLSEEREREHINYLCSHAGKLSELLNLSDSVKENLIALYQQQLGAQRQEGPSSLLPAQEDTIYFFMEKHNKGNLSTADNTSQPIEIDEKPIASPIKLDNIESQPKGPGLSKELLYLSLGQVKAYFKDYCPTYGSGVLIDNRHVLTIAPCVFTNKKPPESVTFFSYCREKDNYTLPIEARSIAVHAMYFGESSHDESNYNYALITLSQEVKGLKTSFNSCFYLYVNEIGNFKYKMYYFERSSKERKSLPLSLASQEEKGSSKSILNYIAETSPGSGGAPILFKAEKDHYHLVGINQGFASLEDKHKKVGLNITEKVQKLIQLMITEEEKEVMKFVKFIPSLEVEKMDLSEQVSITEAPLKLTANEFEDEKVSKSLQPLLTPDMDEVDIHWLIEALTEVPVGEREEVARSLQLLLAPGMRWYDRNDIIKALTNIPTGKREEFAKSIQPLLTPGMGSDERATIIKDRAREEVAKGAQPSLFQDMNEHDRDSMIKSLDKVVSNEEEEFTKILQSLLTPEIMKHDGSIIKEALTNIPAGKREGFMKSLQLLLAPGMMTEERHIIIRALIKISSNEREEFAKSLQPLLTPDMDEGDIHWLIEDLTEVPVGEREEVARSVQPLLAPGMIWYDRKSIIKALTNIPTGKREEFAKRIQPLLTPDMKSHERATIIKDHATRRESSDKCVIG